MTSPFLPSSFSYGDSPQGGVVMPMVIANRAPSNTIDRQYAAGYFWLAQLPQSTGLLYYQAGNTAGTPNWTVSSAAAGAVNTISSVIPIAGNINLVGTTNQIVATPGPGEITFSLGNPLVTPGALTVTGLFTASGGTSFSGGLTVTGGLTTDTLTSTGATTLATTGASINTFGNNTGATAITLSVGTGNFVLNGVTNSTITIGTGLTTGTILIGGATETGAITVGSSSGAANSVLIANGTGSTTVSIANVTTAGATLNVMEAANTVGNIINICNGAPAADCNISILSGTATAGALQFNVFGGTATTIGGTINLGTAGAAHVVNIGNATPATASKVQILVGTGSTPDFKLDGLATSTYAFGASTTTGTIDIGGTAMTGAGIITLGNSSAASTVKIARGSGASTVTIAEGTAGANEVDILNGNIAAVGTVKILSGVGLAGAAGSILQMANNTRVATIDLGNIAPSAARTTTIAGGNSAQNDTVNILDGNPTANTQTVSILSGVGSGTHTKVLNLANTTMSAGTATVNIMSGNATGGTLDVNIVGDAAVTTAVTTKINTGGAAHVLTIGNALSGAQTWNVGAGNFTMNGGGNTISIGADAANTINIASGAFGSTIHIGDNAGGANIITIGSASGAASLALKAGTGNFSLDGAATTTYTIAPSSTSGTFNLGGTGADVTSVTLWGGTGAQTISLANNTGVKTINIAGDAATSNNVIKINSGVGTGGSTTIGSTTGGSTVTIRAGTGNINLTGNVVKSTNPAFLGYLAATVNNKTGIGTAYTLGTDALTKVFDRGTNFTTAGVFTAPVTGIYDLRAQVNVSNTTIATTFTISIVTTARTYQYTFIKAAGAQSETVSISSLCDMSATDTAHVTIAVSGEGGDTNSITGSATLVTYFTGCLVA